MERIDLAKTIQESAATFCQNRIGDKPPMSVTVSPTVTDIPWPDPKLQELVKVFLYEALLTNDPDAELRYRCGADRCSRGWASLSACNLHIGFTCASMVAV